MLVGLSWLVMVMVVIVVGGSGWWGVGVGILGLLSPTARKRQESFKRKGLLCQESRDSGK